MNTKTHISLYWLIFWPFCCLSQETIKPDQVKLENNKVAIYYQVKDYESCVNVKSVVITIVATQQKIIAKALSGDLSEVKAGNHLLSWDYRADNFYVDGQIDVAIIVQQCKNTYPQKTVSARQMDRKTPYPISLKLGVAGIGIASGIGAFVLRKNYINKLDVLKNLDAQFNRSSTLSEPQFSQWNQAYNEAQSARKVSLANALLGIAAVTVGVETYLMLGKKASKKKFSLFPSNEQMGITMIYKL